MEWAASAEPAPDAWRENVAAVVLDAGGCVLLGLGTGANAYWHFPQGGISGKETLQDALRRELWEEVRLAPESYRIITCLGGLRYRYRKHNDKSERWRGQEQSYFLVLCHAQKPATDCSHTNEFCALSWVPWRELTAELFAPAKRKVVSKVLAAFFPPHLTVGELLPYLQNSLSPKRYLLVGRALDACPAEERKLYAGGKEEMQNTLARLMLQLRAAHRSMAPSGGKLLVLLHGAAGSGRRQCLRRLAAGLEPLQLCAAEAAAFAAPLPWDVLQQLPMPGGISLIIHSGEHASSSQSWQLVEHWLMKQGIRLLKLYLHTEASTDADAALLAATDSASAPWYVIPAERRWYRDYLVATLVIAALEEVDLRAPLSH